MATPKKKPVRKAAPKKVKPIETDVIDQVVVLTTSVDHPLVIRANPSDEEVRGFVAEHTRRYVAGEPGGPSNIPAYRIFTAKRYADEVTFITGGDNFEEVNIADLLPA